MIAKRKYAILVGCNYPNTENELHGCVNDVLTMQGTLIRRFGFAKRNINLLIDTDEAYTKPTGEKIRAALLAMVRRAKSGNILYFHYSGHDTLARLHNSSNYDECIVPCDFNLLTDEDFRFIVNKVPLGTTFSMVSDSCHSGGLIDKENEQIGPHAKRSNRSLTDPETSARCSSKSKFLPLDSLLNVLREKTGEVEMEAGKIKNALFQLFGDKASSKVKRLVNTNNSVIEAEKGENKGHHVYEHEELQRIDEDMGILLSGCQTNQTSADAYPTWDLSKAYGAFSNSIQTILEQHETLRSPSTTGSWFWVQENCFWNKGTHSIRVSTAVTTTPMPISCVTNPLNRILTTFTFIISLMRIIIRGINEIWTGLHIIGRFVLQYLQTMLDCSMLL